ncbi:MAG: hypothetical protein R3E98_13950 [Gemmatimonadota bacterium]|nr:hypothetical protein [Gemmatimonadota bacterium]
MTEMRACPRCTDVFVVPPAPCPNCGTRIDPTPGASDGAVVVQYRLNRLGAATGVALAGAVSGVVTWALGLPAFALVLLLAGLALGAALLLVA